MPQKSQVLLAIVVCVLVGLGLYQLLGSRGAEPTAVNSTQHEQPAPTPENARVDPLPTQPMTAPVRTAAPVDVQPVTDLDPSIRAALCGLTGRLVNQERQPVANSEVKLLRIGLESFFEPGVGLFASERTNAPDVVVGRTRSGSDGRFLIPGVFPYGDFMLHADADGDAPTWLIVERAVAPGETADLGDIVLEQAGTLLGIVVDQEGNPLRDALVRAVDLPGTVLSLVPFERFDPKGALVAETPDKRAILIPSWVEQRMEDLPIPHTRTDSEGRFRLRGVRPGGNLVAFNSKGWEPQVKPRVVVRGGEEKDLGTIRMTEGESVVGKVIDQNGKPVAGAQVLVASRSPAAPIHFASFVQPTDSEGAFSAAGFPTGDVIAAARRSDGEPWVFSDMQPITRDIVIQVPSLATLTVKVVDLQQAPIADARLQLTAGDDQAFLVMAMFGAGAPVALDKRTTRGEHGELILSDLPLGHYIVLADSPHHAVASKKVELRADAEVDLALKPKTSITVIIRRPDGSPAVGADLFAHSRGENAPDVPLHAGKANADGKVEVDVPPECTVRLTARHPAYGLSSTEAKVPLAEPVQILFATPGALEGVVTESGAPPEPGKYMVYASPTGGGRNAVPQIPLISAPDLEGKFRFPALAPGDYYVGVTKALGGLRSPGGALGLVRDSWLDSRMPSDRITVTAGGTAQVALETMEVLKITGPTVRLTGVVTVNGRLAKGHVVTLDGTGPRQRIQVDQAGRFLFERVPVGNGSLTVSQPPPEDLFASRGRPADLMRQALEVKEGTDLDLNIEILTTTIEGEVRTAAGAPVADVNVYATGQFADGRGPGVWRNARTDARGQFRFEAIAPGTWSLNADKDSVGRAKSASLAVTGDVPISGVALILSPTLRLRGRVDLTAVGAKASRAHLYLQPTEDGEQGAWSRLEDDGSFDVHNATAGGTYRAQISYQDDKDEWHTAFGDQPIVVAGRDVEGILIRAVAQPTEDVRGKR